MLKTCLLYGMMLNPLACLLCLNYASITGAGFDGWIMVNVSLWPYHPLKSGYATVYKVIRDQACENRVYLHLKFDLLIFEL